MIGVILLALSWVLLRLQGKPLTVLGFNRPAQRAVEFAAGLLLAAVFAGAQFLMRAELADFRWVFNAQLALSQLLEGVRWVVNSVLYEELLFRGYLLYQAIQYLGARKGCWLSAAAFGVYHWFSYSVLGSLVPMLYVFLYTGLFGLMLAWAFARTQSIILPIALHLGWNLTTILVFSAGPIGAQLLLPVPPDAPMPGVWSSVLVNHVWPLILPAVVLCVLLCTPLYSKRSTEATIDAS